jgi:hypothetical protein
VRKRRVPQFPVNWGRNAAQPLQQADLLAWARVGLRSETEVEQVDLLLDDDALFEAVRDDPARGAAGLRVAAGSHRSSRRDGSA